ncbi:MAG TPA: VWA domain-containing protein, partial [Blastocatellia bacterium]|nr:VWA domain-containing protein [Blastocatellia bacterium]
MSRLCVLAVLLICLAGGPAFTRQQSGQSGQKNARPEKPPEKTTDQDVVRISVTLVQVDAVVTDANGHPVTDLKREDFEVYEDGRKQSISNFSYISTLPAAPSEVAAPPRGPVDKTAPPATPVRVEPGQVRRTVAFVVDDLSLSFQSMHFVRDTLTRFVNEQMQPGDLVAIIRTGAGMGALQQFTSDKRQLSAAIDRVRYNMMGHGGITPFAPIESSPATTQADEEAAANGDDSSTTTGAPTIDTLRDQLFTVGTLGAVNFVVRSLRGLPGRKSIVLLSDGFSITSDDEDNNRVLNELHALIDLANRSSVVVYSIDARGLQPLGLSAADAVGRMSSDQLQTSLQNRRDQLFNTQAGLEYLAEETGGFFVGNTNDLTGGVRKVMDDQAGYYLIGYIPEEATFKATERGRQFHKLEVKVKRPGLHVRYRSGFYGIPEEEVTPEVATTPQAKLLNALTSPFGSGGVHLRMTSLFGNDPKLGSFVRSLLHIDAHDLTFSDEADGWHKAVVDVVSMTFGDNGQVIDRAARTFTISTRGEQYQAALERGLVCNMDVPIRKPGAYQVRTAVRDEGSDRVGSANQFIEVPDLKKDRLTLSGVILTSASEPQTGEPKAGEESKATAGSVTSPAVRVLADGSSIRYAFLIFNAKIDKTTNRPNVETQVRLFKDGKAVYSGPFRPYSPGAQTQPKRLAAIGTMRL